MLDSPVWLVTPTTFCKQGASLACADPTPDPIGDCIRAAEDGDSIQLAPGDFPRARGPWGGKQSIHLCGWDRKLGISTIKRDDNVGSSDSFILGARDAGFVLESLNIEADDRAGVKTTSGVGKKHALIDVNIFGRGSPIDPAWTDTSKWGVHTYDVAGWNEIRCWKWGIYGEHGDYHHNQQGVINYSGGGAGFLGGCDLMNASRMNEGDVGRGDTNVFDRYIEDVCVGQGGSALTFRGGVPGGKINLTRVTARLGCNKRLAAPFNQNICGVFSSDSADETRPGANDAAWPGTYAEVNFSGIDFEVGTVYPGRTGMIRPVVVPGNCDLFTMHDSRIRVTRAPGAYPIGLSIPETCKKVQIWGRNEIDCWVEFHGARYTSWNLFVTAHPECFA